MSVHDDGAWELMDRRVAALTTQTSLYQQVYLPQAEPSPALLQMATKFKKVEVQQSFRPYFNQLLAAGVDVHDASAPGRNSTLTTPALILFVATRQRVESLGIMGRALLDLKADDLFIFACANSQGASGFISKLREVAPQVEADSKNKCRIMEIKKSDIQNEALLEQWVLDAGPTRVAGSEFQSVPGIYGWNKIDAGSKLLASTLPELEGVGLDLGAGYGYLTWAALQKSGEKISQMHLVEADARALECARNNLSPWIERCHFYWLDVVAERSALAQLPPVDWILMNPPFHEGREADATLGNEFIKSAAEQFKHQLNQRLEGSAHTESKGGLKKKGQLFMVANAFLPYEKILNASFRKVSRVLERDGFKVIHAQR